MCKLLRQWRAEADLTQRALADLLGKPHSYVWKVEAGERRVDPIEFVRWCRACNVKPSDAVNQIG